MNKHDQTKVSGIGTTPNCELDMNLFVPSDIIFIEVKDRSEQSLTTEKIGLVKTIKYDELATTELLMTLCEGQESLIEEQEEKIHDLEAQLQDYEQEIYEKDLKLQQAEDIEPKTFRSNFEIEAGTGGNQK